jgi:hypothetical protein
MLEQRAVGRNEAMSCNSYACKSGDLSSFLVMQAKKTVQALSLYEQLSIDVRCQLSFQKDPAARIGGHCIEGVRCC